MIRKIIAIAICLILFFGYYVFLEIQGVNPKTLGGAIPGIIVISAIYFVWNKITLKQKNRKINFYQRKQKWKYVLFVEATIIASASLILTNMLVKNLESSTNQLKLNE